MAYERDVRLIAARQHGVIHRRQALAVGMTDRMIRRRVASGVWVRMKPGTFLLYGYPETLKSLLAAATAALPAVVSHEAAGELHGLSEVPPGRAVVTVPVRHTYHFPGVIVHQSTDLADEFVTTVDGLPVTTVERTLVDLAAILQTRHLQRVVEGGLVAKKVELDVLLEVFNALARRGRPGVRRLRAVLQATVPGFEVAESVLEARLLGLLLEAGLPHPVQQYPLSWRTISGSRADFAYPDARLIIEADGRRWHMAAGAFDADRRRDNLATMAGWRVLRFTWSDVVDRPEEVVALVRQALHLDGTVRHVG